MKLTILFAAAAALALAPAAGALTVESTAHAVTSHWIVGFYQLPADRSQYAGNPVVNVNDVIDFFVVETANPNELKAFGNLDTNVRYIEADLEVVHTDLVPNDPYYSQQYSMKPTAVNAEVAWDKGFGTTSTKLCIVDTGQDRTHPDLSSLTFFYWKDEVNGKLSAYDDHGHGTHVTGTAAARTNNGVGVAGLAPGVSVGATKVLNRRGSGTWAQVSNGVTDCGTAGAHIESLSLGGSSGSSTLQNAVTSFLNGGGFMAAAAGNSGPCTNCVGYPAAYAGVTAVACSDESNSFCSFSSQGPQVSLIAPGSNIISTAASGSCSLCDPSGYISLSGTSMSTPHVAGVAALYKSTHPTATGSAIQTALKAGAKNLGLPSDQQGAGLLQASVV